MQSTELKQIATLMVVTSSAGFEKFLLGVPEWGPGQSPSWGSGDKFCRS